MPASRTGHYSRASCPTETRRALNVEELDNVTEAQVLVNSFNEEYNHERPHRALNMMTPHEFAQSYKLAGR